MANAPLLEDMIVDENEEIFLPDWMLMTDEQLFEHDQKLLKYVLDNAQIERVLQIIRKHSNDDEFRSLLFEMAESVNYKSNLPLDKI